MIGLLFNSIYIIVDGLFIGNRLGRDAMAAAAVGVPLVEILIALSMAITSGAGVLISSQLGAGDKKRAVTTFNLAIRIAGIAGVLIMCFCNLFIDPIAEVLGSTPHSRRHSARY